jgi:catechol 2,3-dioxygenase-like lactoylglutathione lyase family enzyme
MPDRHAAAPSTAADARSPGQAWWSRAARRAQVRGVALGFELVGRWHKARHWLGNTDGMRIRGVDHLTLPCHDLRIAEDFYAGVLGARVLIRLDEERLIQLGRPADEARNGKHTSLVFDGGPRLDLFEHPIGQPPLLASHPHLAFSVTPPEMLRWKARLERSGVPTDGPRRLGPPGQASLYFNDPFGNHLELTTMGFAPEIPLGPPDMASLEYVWKRA